MNCTQNAPPDATLREAGSNGKAADEAQTITLELAQVPTAVVA